MSALKAVQCRAKPILSRFYDSTDGAYAVEFAAMGSLFIVIVLVISQYAMLYLARESLDLALQQASRALLTGRFQQSNAGLSNQTEIIQNLQAIICGTHHNSRNWMFKCSDLKLDVHIASSFTASSTSQSAVDRLTGKWASDFGRTYTCPGPKSIAIVRAAVKYPVFARGLVFGLTAFIDGSALLQSAVVFRVEPYQSGSGSAC